LQLTSRFEDEIKSEAQHDWTSELLDIMSLYTGLSYDRKHVIDEHCIGNFLL